MKYLVVDASLNGTGIRDYYEGGYVDLEDLRLSSELIRQINEWLLRYENEHYNGFINNEIINDLDREGKEIALAVKGELLEAKVEYFSDAKMKRDVL